MKNNQVKRLIALALSFALILSATACGGDSGSSSSSGGQSSQEQSSGQEEEAEGQSESQAESQSQAQAGQDLRKVTCVGPTKNEYDVDKYSEWETGKLFDQELADRNIELEIELIPTEQFNDTMKNRLASNLDLPDIIRAAGTQVDYVNYGKSGMTWNIKELLETYDEDGSIWAYLEKNSPTSFKTILDENGDLWWLPYSYRSVSPGGSAYVCSIRADWLEALGKEWKPFYTLDELLDVFVEFREKDANGNGVADEVLSFNPASEWEPISAAFGMGQKYIYVLTDGKGVQCKLDHENFPAFIEYCQKLYEAGVFSTEILNSDNGIISGNRASAIYNYNAESWEEPGILGYETTARYAPIVIDDDEGVNGYNLPGRDNSDMCLNAWLVNKDCEDPQAVVDLLDYIYSDEGMFELYWGIEGTSFEYNEAGYPQLIDRENLYNNKEHQYRLPLWNVVTCNVLPGSLYGETPTEEAYYTGEHREGFPEKDAFLPVLVDAKSRDIPYCPQTQPLAMMSTEETEKWEKVSTDVQTYIEELILDLVMGNKSLDDLATYRAEVGELGLDTMIEIRKAQHDRYLNN